VFLSLIIIVFILESILYFIIRGMEAGKGWNSIGGGAFACLRLLPVLFHEENSIGRSKISQKCAKRSRKNTHDFTVFG